MNIYDNHSNNSLISTAGTIDFQNNLTAFYIQDRTNLLLGKGFDARNEDERQCFMNTKWSRAPRQLINYKWVGIRGYYLQLMVIVTCSYCTLQCWSTQLEWNLGLDLNLMECYGNVGLSHYVLNNVVKQTGILSCILSTYLL